MKRIYLDHNATTPMRPEVLSYMTEFAGYALNPSSLHCEGRLARKLLEEARTKIKVALGLEINDPYRVIFMASGSEANNLVINSFKDATCLIAETEHLSILKPAQMLENHLTIPVNGDGLIDLGALEALLSKTPGKKLVSVMLANNETGVINDLGLISTLCRKMKALLHTDAVQALGKIAVDIKTLGVDMMTISSHKFGGPPGIAALIIKDTIELSPMIIGGGQERGLRAGTENIPAIIGFGKAAELIADNLNKMAEIKILRDELELNLGKSTNAIIFGSRAPRLPNTSYIAMAEVSSETQLIHFDLNNIAASSGSACSSGRVNISHVLASMGIAKKISSCAVRISMGFNTTRDEVQYFTDHWFNKSKTGNT